MKHLKLFEDISKPQRKFFTQDDLDDIKDIFRDILDEYDMELNPNSNADVTIEFIDLMLMNSISKVGRVIIHDITKCDLIRVLIVRDKFWPINFINEISNIVKRLEQMGYHVEVPAETQMKWLLQLVPARYYFYISKV